MEQIPLAEWNATPYKQGKGCYNLGKHHTYKVLDTEGPYTSSRTRHMLYVWTNFTCADCGYYRRKCFYLK